MKHTVLQNIQKVAKHDFDSIKKSINSQQDTVTASIRNIRYVSRDDVVTATCCFDFKTDVVEASINYGVDTEGVYADSGVDEVASEVLGALQPVMAADGDDEFDDPESDAFDFDEVDEEITTEDEESVVDDEGAMLEDDEMEDPESEPEIEVDNNIENHYIVECDRCHGIFISALVESDQVVDHITGVCPLCEKESDQLVKWIVKPVEF